MPTTFVKGYLFSEEKAASALGLEPGAPLPLFSALSAFQEQLDRDAYVRLAAAFPLGQRHGVVFVVVLDESFDEQALRERPLGPLHPSLERSMPLLDRLDIWEST